MSSRQVEAIWVFKYSLSHFKALYGRRVKGDKTYSKDFLQIPRDCGEEFERVIGRTLVVHDEEPFTYKWPGGKMDEGKIRRTTDRLNLRWPTRGEAPAPWRMAPSIAKGSLETFQGDPNLATTAAADLEWQRFESLDQEPWLVVAKLRDEPGVLHLRAYLGNPPAYLQHCSTAQLPLVIRELMDNLRRSTACGVVSLGYQIAVSPDLRRLLAMLKADPDVQVVGPHNLGKSADQELADLLERTDDILWFDPDRNHDAFQPSP